MLSDLRFSLRQLAKSPGFTTVALLTLALGIGANTAIFSLVKSVLLNPLPYPHPEQLISLWEDQRLYSAAPLSWPDLVDWQREQQAFTALAGYRRVNYILTGTDDPAQLNAAQVSASFFSVIGLPPQLGRVFTAEEDKGGAEGVVVLSDAFWRRRFHADPLVIGQKLALNQEVFTIVGVLPPEFSTPADVDFYTQLGRPGGYPIWQNRGNRPGIFALGRMKPGFTADTAISHLRRVSAQISRAHPDTNTQIVANGQPLFDQLVGGYRGGLWLLLSAVALVLLIACANLANLLLARGAARVSEFAVRAALGASRAHLVRQLMLENLLLAVAGGGAGLLVAAWAHRGIALLAPAGVARFQEASLDAPVLCAAAALALVTVVLFGLWPAWKAAQVDVRDALQSGGSRSSSAGPDARRAREVLIVAEVALTLVLLVGAGLLLKSFAQAQSADLGFSPRGVFTARVALPYLNYDTAEKMSGFRERLLDRLANLPGVKSADIAAVPPLSTTGDQNGYTIEGRPPPPAGQIPQIELNAVSDGYFRALGIRLLRGRPFGLEDASGRPPVIIVDQGFADRQFPHEDPIGRRILLGDRPLTIIGVVSTVRLSGYAVEPTLPQGYVSVRQMPVPRFFVLVCPERPAMARSETFAAAVRHAMRDIDANQPISDVRTLEERVESTFANSRLYTFLLAGFAALALLLATVGLYGVLAYHVAQRRREFGIRLALGAVGSQVATQVFRRGLRLIGLGTAIGLLASLALNRLLGSLLYRTNPFDLGVIGAVTGLLALIALAAAGLPALRAAKIDPVDALRAE